MTLLFVLSVSFSLNETAKFEQEIVCVILNCCKVVDPIRLPLPALRADEMLAWEQLTDGPVSRNVQV